MPNQINQASFGSFRFVLDPLEPRLLMDAKYSVIDLEQRGLYGYGIDNAGTLYSSGYKADGSFILFRMSCLGYSDVTAVQDPSSGQYISPPPTNASGVSVEHDGPQIFFRHDGTTIKTITLPNNQMHAMYLDINDDGVIVGTIFRSGSRTPTPFVSQNDVLINLNTLIPVDSNWLILYATGINNQGQIVAQAQYDGGDNQAVLLNPVWLPDPFAACASPNSPRPPTPFDDATAKPPIPRGHDGNNIEGSNTADENLITTRSDSPAVNASLTNTVNPLAADDLLSSPDPPFPLNNAPDPLA